MDLISNHLIESLIIVGLVLLSIEILVLGFSTFVLFFVGIAALMTGVLMYAEFIPETLMSAVLSVAIITAVDAVLLWKPLKNMQTKVDKKVAESDLIGHSFTLETDVGPNQPGSYHYSGINWKLVSTKAIGAGTKVKVVRIEVGAFFIEPD